MRHLLRSLVIIALVFAVSCSWLKSTAKETASAFVDCTAPAVKDTVDAFGPLVEHLIISATNDHGGVDFDPVRSIASSLKTTAQRCVLASVISTLATPRVRDPNAPQSDALTPDPSALRGGFDKIRAELYGGTRFKTAAGDL